MMLSAHFFCKRNFVRTVIVFLDLLHTAEFNLILIETPTAGKSASLTFRLVLRASQPITMPKMFLAASAMPTPTSTSTSHNMLKYPHAESLHI